MLGQRLGVAVEEVEAERLGLELVDGALAGLDQPGAEAGDAVHVRRVDAVEVHRVRMGRTVAEVDAEPFAFLCPQGRPGTRPSKVQAGNLTPGRDLDLLVDRVDVPLAQGLAVRQLAGLAPVEVAEDVGRVEAVEAVVDHAAGRGRSARRG